MIAPIVFGISAPLSPFLPAYASDGDSNSALSKADTRLLKFTPDPISIAPETAKSDNSDRNSNEETTKNSGKESTRDIAKDSDDRRDASSEPEARRRSLAQNTSGKSNESPSTSLSDFSSNPEEAARQLAQSLAKKPSVTSISGTVQVRRPFKLFASQELLHNMSFRTFS